MTPKRGYRLHLSRRDTILKEREGQGQKFRKMVSVLSDFGLETRALTLPMIGDPDRFSATDFFDTKKLSYRFIRWIAAYLYRWIPTYVWILKKK